MSAIGIVVAYGALEGRSQSGEAKAGRALYTTYCRSCHGPEGAGDGFIREYLRVPPANLTVLAKNNNGVFPAERVQRIIDGRQTVRPHGESQMPVWGDAFAASDVGGAPQDPTAKIAALVAYIKSIQAKAP